jgi:hypothetical protein
MVAILYYIMFNSAVLMIIVYSDESVDPLIDCSRSGSKFFQKSSLLILIIGALTVFVIFVSNHVKITFRLSVFVELL